MVGTAATGLDGLLTQLQVWEEETRKEQTGERHGAPRTIIDAQSLPSTKIDLTPETLRYALIGMMFEAQNQVRYGMKEVEQSSRKLEELLAPVLELAEQSEMLEPVRQEFDRLVARGEAEVSRMVEMGRAEEEHSRSLLNNAMTISADTTISQVVENPRVEELVHKQSVGLANEIVEEVRERGVSIDTYLERWVRLRLRRKSRDTLPVPVVQPELPKAHMRPPETPMSE
jgi:predicted transcriptional regulator